MNNIRYRAWDKKSKKMRQVVDIVFNTGFYLEPNNNTVKLVWLKGYDIIEQKDIMIKREKDFELLQSTGIFDKNGTEIYEGDILLRQTSDKDSWKTIVLVKRGKVELSFLRKPYNKRTDNHIRWHRTTYQGLDTYGEIIGNIYENPELLEEDN